MITREISKRINIRLLDCLCDFGAITGLHLH
jgi:hypothetical protein